MNKYKLLVWMVILSVLAGLINAIAIFGFGGTTVSHMTGLVSKFGISVACGDISGGMSLLFVIVMFFAGAVFAGILTGEKTFQLKKIYGYIVFVIGILLLLPPFLSAEHSILLLAFLMGLQNGMALSFKGVLFRSTHMSGNLTDLGTYVGYIIRGNKTEKPVSALIPGVSLLGFSIGGIIGILLYSCIGNYVFAAAAAVYFLLGIVYFSLRKRCNSSGVKGTVLVDTSP